MYKDSVRVVTEAPLVVAVTLEGEFDMDHRADSLFEQAAAFSPTEVLLECGEVSFCDSSFVRALLTLREQLDADGRRLRIVHPSRPMVRLLFLTGIEHLFSIEHQNQG